MSEFKRREEDEGALARMLKKIAGIITSLVVIMGAIAFAADTRYAQKEELHKEVQGVLVDMRKTTLDDKIFEIQLTPEAKRSDVQRALLDRYVREADTLRKAK